MAASVHPMRAFVRFTTPLGTTAELGHGDLVGRLPAAALCIDDPRVSEAHALVSLRRGELHLLALRRMVAVAGKPVTEVRLKAGLVVELAEGVALTVERVTTPERVLALVGPGLGQRVLGQVASVSDGDPPVVAGKFVPGAGAHLWSVGGEWHLRVGDAPVRVVAAGDAFRVGKSELRLTAVAIAQAGPASTQLEGGVGEPLRIVAHYDSAEVHRPGRPAVTVGGVGARILGELIAFGGPVSWETCAREIWADDVTAVELRHRWDVALGRLRSRLREAGVRADLIRSDRSGQLQLVLGERDIVEDRT